MATKNHSRSNTGHRPVASYEGIPKAVQQWVRAMMELHKLAGTKVSPKQVWQNMLDERLKERANKAERERHASDKEPVDTERISCVLLEIQDQLRALVSVARTDRLEEPYRGESLQTLSQSVGIRCHLMLDECLKQMGHGWAGNFEDSFADLDKRRGATHA